MKQKYFLITILSLAFVFTASAAYANLSFTADTVSSDGSLTLTSADNTIRSEGTLVVGPNFSDAYGYAYPSEWLVDDYNYGIINFSQALETYSYGLYNQINVDDYSTQSSNVTGVSNNVYSNVNSSQGGAKWWGAVNDVAHRGSGVITTGLSGSESYAYNYISNSPNADLYGAYADGRQYSTGTVKDIYGLSAQAKNSAGNATNLYAAYLSASGIGGISTTNAYGLYVTPVAGATNNYNIFSAGASSNNRFEGSITVGPSTLPGDLQNTIVDAQQKITALDRNGLGVIVTNGEAIYGVSSGTAAYGVEGDAYGQYALGIYGYASGTTSGGQVTGVYAIAGAESGITVDQLAGLWVDAPFLSGASATNLYGILVEDQSGGTNNFAIKTGAGKVQFGDVLKITPVAFSSLPTCNAGAEGTIRPITDSSSAVFNATITGGGANHVIAYCNGTNWTVH